MIHAKTSSMLCQTALCLKLIELFFSARTEDAIMKGAEFLMNRNGVDSLQHDAEEDVDGGWHETQMKELSRDCIALDQVDDFNGIDDDHLDTFFENEGSKAVCKIIDEEKDLVDSLKCV